MEPFVTPDGQVLLFNDANTPGRNTDLHWARRSGDASFEYEGRIEGANSAALDGVPSMDLRGTFYFVSTRSYDDTASTIYSGAFSEGVLTNVRLVPGISPRRPPLVNFDVEVTQDGRTLTFVDGWFDRASQRWASASLVLAVDDGSGFRRTDAAALELVNSDELEYAPAFDRELRTLYFTRAPQDLSAPPQIWVSVRPRASDQLCPPARIEGLGEFVEAATVVDDGAAILYHRRTSEGFRLFSSRRVD